MNKLNTQTKSNKAATLQTKECALKTLYKSLSLKCFSQED